MNIDSLKDKIITGHQITKDEALHLASVDIEQLANSANQIREHFFKNNFNLCSIVNCKCGKCTEDCKFCAQSKLSKAIIEKVSLTNNNEKLINKAKYNYKKGISRISIVTCGQTLTDEELETVCENLMAIKKNCKISLCASLGLLNEEQLKKLKLAGLNTYHCNLETSKRYFPQICSTHTYDDKIKTIKAAQAAGLDVCSGVLIGLGETMEDRVDLAFVLKELGIKSIPVNVLNPIKGTPMENVKFLPMEEIIKTIAIYKFILFNARIRMAGGRGLMQDKGRFAILSGANAAISGDMLTTAGVHIDDDIKMLDELGFEI